MILRLVVAIPTFNNPTTIEQVISEVLEQTSFPVLVVDDGSDISVQSLLQSSLTLNALKNGRLTILRLEHNSGKGVALQRGLQKSLELGFTHMLSIDGDGQHLTREISKLVEMAKTNPWSFIIGARRMHGETVPQVSKFGRAFSNFWVQFQTGTQISDSQSGFRLYPLFHLQNMHFWCRRYDFEIEVLIRLMWKGVEILEIEIDVFYPEKDQRISHFHKLWDNVRISILNTALVILSLLNSRKSPSQTGFAVGTGVLIGCTPFFGFHTLMVAAVSFLFRLNAVYLWLGTQVSLPPIAPFVIIASIVIGHRILPDTGATDFSFQRLSHLSFTELLSLAEHVFRPWLVGSLILGVGLGVIFGFGSALLAKRFQERKTKKPTWNGRTRGGAFGNGFLKIVLKFLGVRAGYFCLLFIVPYFYLFAPKGRKSLSEYWKIVRPQQSFLLRQFTIMNHFYRFGQVLMDTVFQNHNPKAEFKTKPNGIENILEAAEARKGLILLSAHVGAWSLAASLLDNDGFRQEFYVVEYQAQGPNFNQVRGDFKETHVKQFQVQQGSPSIFDLHIALGKGQTIGVMADRPLGNRYELISFFGKLAPFDVTPFRLATTLKVPLLFSFGFKGENLTYDFFASKPKVYHLDRTVDQRLQCLAWAQEFAHHLETLLMKYPNQWFNFYPFWSSLPASPLGEKTSLEQNHLREELQRPRSQEFASGPVPSPNVES